MNKEISVNFRLYENGKLNLLNVALVGVPIAAFVLWRVFGSGVYGSERILGAIETELLDDYKHAIYEEYGLMDRDYDSERAAQLPYEELQDLELSFTDVSMAAPLLSWGSREAVVVRFDYVIEADGEVKESGEDVYKRISRRHGITVWDSGPVSYYMNYVF